MPQSQTKRTPQAFLTDPTTLTTPLLLLLVDTYGMECLEWAPETIRMQLESDFGIKLPKLTADRLMAGIMLLTTDYFFKSLPRFLELANVLSGEQFDPGTLSLPGAMDCAWALTEALIIWPPDEEEPFTDEIRGYLKVILMQEGFVTPPDILRLALDGDISQLVNDTWAESDPELFTAAYEMNQAKSADVNTGIRETLTALSRQLRELPLKNGDAENFLKQVKLDRP